MTDEASTTQFICQSWSVKPFLAWVIWIYNNELKFESYLIESVCHLIYVVFVTFQIHLEHVKYIWNISNTFGTCQIHLEHVKYISRTHKSLYRTFLRQPISIQQPGRRVYLHVLFKSRRRNSAIILNQSLSKLSLKYHFRYFLMYRQMVVVRS